MGDHGGQEGRASQVERGNVQLGFCSCLLRGVIHVLVFVVAVFAIVTVVANATDLLNVCCALLILVRATAALRKIDFHTFVLAMENVSAFWQSTALDPLFNCDRWIAKEF